MANRWDGLTTENRFWQKVDKSCPNGCWEWTASKTGFGYGQFRLNGTMAISHRVSYEMVKGKIPLGYMVDHICHNKICVNPDHLRIASRAENLRNSARNKNNACGFKGVIRSSSGKAWVAKIYAHGKNYHLGTFKTPQEAHKAYCDAATKLHGQFAHFG